jgi:hypothetical protein
MRGIRMDGANNYHAELRAWFHQEAWGALIVLRRALRSQVRLYLHTSV